MPDCLRTGELRFGGAAATAGVAAGTAASLLPLTVIFVGATAFAFFGVTALTAFFAAVFFGAAFLRAPVLRLRAFAPAALDRFLVAARTSLFFLPAPCLDAFVGFLRFAACLRLVAMGQLLSHRRSKDTEGRDLTREDGASRLARPVTAHRYQPRVASASNPNTLKTSGFRSKL